VKYYCKNCGSVIDTDRDLAGLQSCFICGWRYANGYETTMPDWETPAQYKKRTGKEYHDKGLVFFRHVYGDGTHSYWKFETYLYAKHVLNDEEVVIAEPPIPPPNGWRPAEGMRE